MFDFSDLEFEYLITLRRVDCPKCGSDNLHKRGKATDGIRQIVKCLNCKRKSTIDKRIRGERVFDKNKLLPILCKNPESLNNAELYCMGLLITDGSLSNTNQMSFTVKEKDVELAEIIKRELQIKNAITVETKTTTLPNKEKFTGTYKRITWGYKYSEAYWSALGLCSEKTSNEMWLPYMCAPSFVRGLIDGDGSVSHNTKQNALRITFTNAGKHLTENLQQYIYNNLAIHSNISVKKYKIEVYGLSYYGTAAMLLAEFLYKDSEGLRLERKYNKYLEIKNRHMINETQPPLSN